MTQNRRKLKGQKGEYQLLAQVSKGSMTAIHLATRLDLTGPERFVVLREMLPHQAKDPQALESFLADAKIASRFDHPNLVTVQEMGKSKGAVFTVVEYLAGDGLGFLLGKVVDLVAGMPAPLAAGIVAQAADGLDFAHTLPDTAGLVHGNINLRNIVVLIDGRVKLINFDIGTLASQPHPSRLTAYLSPEQCMGKAVGPSSDIFSLGVVLWELLAGRHLFERENDLETRRAIMNCEVPALADYRRGMAPELDAIVNRCLQKEPFSRYESANAVAAALRGWMQTQGAGAGTEQIRKLVENVLSDRIRLKQNMLEQIEASAQAPVDPEVLLPSASINLPDKQPLEPQPSAPTAPAPVAPAPAAPAPASVPADMVLESPEEVEPVTLRQIDRPPPVPEKTVPPATDPAPPSSESAPGTDPGPEEKEDTPPPFDPSFKFRRSYLQLYDQYQPFVLGGAGVLLLIILIAIFSGGDDEDVTNGKEEPVATKVEVVPKKMTEEEAEAELAKLAPPKKQAMSVLSIKTDPKGCVVLIDKVELEGKTPLRNVMVPSEMEHEVVARCRGFKDESRFITPRAGESMEVEFYPATPAAGN